MLLRLAARIRGPRVLDAEGFVEWFRKGPERAPSLYCGKAGHREPEPVPAPANPIPVRQDVAVELGVKDRDIFMKSDSRPQESRGVLNLPEIPESRGAKDFKSAAAGDGWDGEEDDR